MYRIKKILRQFCAAHRLLKDYPGKCRHLHGHNYVVTLEFESQQLNQYDFVVDFVDVRRLFEDWIKQHLDHGVIVSEADAVLLNFLREQQERYFVLSGQRNTSAECLAEFLFYQFTDLLQSSELDRSHGLRLVSVEVAETIESSAIYSK